MAIEDCIIKPEYDLAFGFNAERGFEKNRLIKHIKISEAARAMDYAMSGLMGVLAGIGTYYWATEADYNTALGFATVSVGLFGASCFRAGNSRKKDIREMKLQVDQYNSAPIVP